MKLNKFLNLAIAAVFMTTNAFAASIGDDNVDLGKPTSSSDKSVTFKGPTSSKKLKGTQAGALSYDGNSFLLGDGANTANKILQFNKGGSSPFFQYNFSTGAIDTGNLSILNHTGDNLHFGDGTNSNKVLKFNKGASSPEIRYNSTNSKLEFTNDGSIYRSIGSGSGSGSGINTLDNPGFEDGFNVNWSNTGGTYATASGGNILYETTGAQFTPSATGQYFESAAVTVPQVLYGALCMVKISYKGADSNVYLTVLDGSSVELIPSGARAVLNATSGVKTAKVYFTCPSTGSFKLRVQSTAAGVIGYYDQAVLGQSDAVQSKQATIIGSARWPTATSCSWPINGAGVGTASAFLTPTADTDCANPILKGLAQAPVTKVPNLRLTNAPPGTYKVTINGIFRISANSAVMSIYDGAGNVGSGRTAFDSTTTLTNAANSVTAVFEYSSHQTALEFAPVVNIISGSPNTTIKNDEITQDEDAYEIIVEFFPSGVDTVLSGKCVNAPDCENNFSMSITNTGTGANSENLDWINGNCSWGGGLWSCNFHPGFFSVAPICTASLAFVPSNHGSASINSISTSSVSVSVINNAVSVQQAFNLRCTRAAADFKPVQEIKGFFSQMLSPIGFSARQNTGQSIPSGTPTTILMNAEGYDTNNAHDTSTGVFTVPETANYMCSCRYSYASFTPAINTVTAQIVKNGVLAAETYYTIGTTANTYTQQTSLHDRLVIGDQIRCAAFQNTGVSRALAANFVYNEFSCNKVGN